MTAGSGVDVVSRALGVARRWIDWRWQRRRARALWDWNDAGRVGRFGLRPPVLDTLSHGPAGDHDLVAIRRALELARHNRKRLPVVVYAVYW